jgi:hypothetical protein
MAEHRLDHTVALPMALSAAVVAASSVAAYPSSEVGRKQPAAGMEYRRRQPYRTAWPLAEHTWSGYIPFAAAGLLPSSRLPRQGDSQRWVEDQYMARKLMRNENIPDDQALKVIFELIQ